jgi:hypothetical protein
MALKNAEKGEASIRLPADASLKVAALIYAVLATIDEDTIEKTYLSLSDEARSAFSEEVGLEELETTMAKIGKIKLGRRYSDAHRRSSVKKDRGSFE